MAKPTRSPLLGYNHNVKYKGRIYHVQTEDSGPSNPHLFTHLYYEGTILATKRHHYDRESAEEVVRSLMQGQHKAILKELKQSLFDGRLSSFFEQRGEPFSLGVTATDMPAITPEAMAGAILPGPDLGPPSLEDVALDLDAMPAGSAAAMPPPELMAPPPAAPRGPGGPGIYQMKKESGSTREDRETTRRFAPTRPSDPMLPLVVFDPPAAGPPTNRPPAPPQASVGRTTESLARLTGGPPPLPRMDTTPTPSVVVQRTVVVGGQSRVVGPGGRPRRPAQPIPYVVKEGSHPLVSQQHRTPPPVPLPPNTTLPSRAASPAPRAPGHPPPPVPMMPPQPGAGGASRSSAAPPGASRAPASELISDKSLDEVILAYLSQGEKD